MLIDGSVLPNTLIMRYNTQIGVQDRCKACPRLLPLLQSCTKSPRRSGGDGMGGLKDWTFPMSLANGDRLKTGANAVSPPPSVGHVPGLPAAGAAAAGPEPEPSPPPRPRPGRRPRPPGAGSAEGRAAAARGGRGGGGGSGVVCPRRSRGSVACTAVPAAA